MTLLLWVRASLLDQPRRLSLPRIETSADSLSPDQTAPVLVSRAVRPCCYHVCVRLVHHAHWAVHRGCQPANVCCERSQSKVSELHAELSM
jgi:hypothetical protein